MRQSSVAADLPSVEELYCCEYYNIEQEVVNLTVRCQRAIYSTLRFMEEIVTIITPFRLTANPCVKVLSSNLMT